MLVYFGVVTGEAAETLLIVEQLSVSHSHVKLFGFRGLLTVVLLLLVRLAMAVHPVIAVILIYYNFLFRVAVIVPISAFYFSRNVRLILATFNFLLRFRGLIIGSILALGVCYFDERYFEFVSSQAMKQSVQKELLETRVTKGKEATKQRPFQQC